MLHHLAVLLAHTAYQRLFCVALTTIQSSTSRCRGDEAVADLEAAQQIYTALGQQAKGNALKADITKIKQLCFSRDSKHATG